MNLKTPNLTDLKYELYAKLTRLTTKLTTANCHVICNKESLPKYLSLCEDTSIFFIIIHDRIKDVVVVNRKSKL